MYYTCSLSYFEGKVKTKNKKLVIFSSHLTDAALPCYNTEKPFTDGLLIQVESGNGNACFFADELLGEYQVVVKPFPTLFNHYGLKKMGLSGCSILGDGSISLIIDAATLILNNK